MRLEPGPTDQRLHQQDKFEFGESQFAQLIICLVSVRGEQKKIHPALGGFNGKSVLVLPILAPLIERLEALPADIVEGTTLAVARRICVWAEDNLPSAIPALHRAGFDGLVLIELVPINPFIRHSVWF